MARVSSCKAHLIVSCCVRQPSLGKAAAQSLKPYASRGIPVSPMILPTKGAHAGLGNPKYRVTTSTDSVSCIRQSSTGGAATHAALYLSTFIQEARRGSSTGNAWTVASSAAYARLSLALVKTACTLRTSGGSLRPGSPDACCSDSHVRCVCACGTRTRRCQVSKAARPSTSVKRSCANHRHKIW